MYEPPPVEFSFEAPGWTYLLWFCLALGLIIGIRQIQKYRKNKYRRDAIKALEQSGNSITEVFVILKHTAMHAYGRAEVSSLSGIEWLTFLDTKARHVDFKTHADVIAEALYREVDIAPDAMKAIASNAKTWIRTHAAS